MESYETGPTRPENIETKLQQAEELGAQIEAVEEQINELTKELREKKEKLEERFGIIAEEVASKYPQVSCSSTDHDFALESGEYYVVGLPAGIDPDTVEIEASSREINLMIDGEKYEGDWTYASTEEDLLKKILQQQKEVGNKE